MTAPPFLREIARVVEDSDFVFILDRLLILGQVRGAQPGSFSALGILNAVRNDTKALLVVEKWYPSTESATGTYDIYTGNSGFGDLGVNITGAGPKGIRDGRLGPMQRLGDDVISLRDNGALVAIPGGWNQIAQIATPTTGYHPPDGLGPFYILPDQWLMVATNAVNRVVGHVIQGTLPRQARRR